MFQRLNIISSMMIGFLASSACYAQDHIVPIEIQSFQESPVPSLQISGGGFRIVSGNNKFYVQTGEGRFVSIDLHGTTQTAMDLSAIPPTDSLDMKYLYMVDMTPDSRGNVLALAMYDKSPDRARAGVARFNSDGTFDDLIWLGFDPYFHVTHIAQFSSSGEFLVNGYDDHGHTKLVLCSGEGAVVVPDVLAETPSISPDAEKKPKKDPVGDAGAQEKAARLQLVSGEDNTIYVFDESVGQKVGRITDRGKVTWIPLAGLPSNSAFPLEMLVTQSNLYLSLADLPSDKDSLAAHVLNKFSIFSFDRYDGTLLATYQVEKSFGAFPLVSSPRDLFFLNPSVQSSGGVSFSIMEARP